MKRISAWILTSAMFLGCFSLCTGFSAETSNREQKVQAVSQISPALNLQQSTVMSSKKEPSLTEELLFYFPNRLMDLLDILTLNLKFGLPLELNIRMTRAFGFGGGVGPSFVICKDFNRQYGAAYQSGWNGQFLFLQSENIERINPIGSVKDFWQYGANFPTRAEGIYTNNIRDYWEFGVSVACIVGVDVYIHPLEFVDFLYGIFILDNRLPQPPFIHDSIPLELMVF